MIKYRATFRGPRGQLNPLGIAIDAAVTIEVFPATKAGRTFRAQTLTPGGSPFRILKYADSDTDISGAADHVKAQVRQMFEERLTPWEELQHLPAVDVAPDRDQGNMFEAQK
jgi:hypothetical protein